MIIYTLMVQQPLGNIRCPHQVLSLFFSKDKANDCLEHFKAKFPDYNFKIEPFITEDEL